MARRERPAHQREREAMRTKLVERVKTLQRRARLQDFASVSRVGLCSRRLLVVESFLSYLRLTAAQNTWSL